MIVQELAILTVVTQDYGCLYKFYNGPFGSCQDIFLNLPLNANAVTSLHSSQGRCSRENCKYLHPPPHLKTQLEINGRNNLIQQKNMAMLAQQMQLANAMMPGTQLPPMVRGHTRMNTPQLLPTVRLRTCKSSHIYGSFLSAWLFPVFRVPFMSVRVFTESSQFALPAVL